MHTSYPLAKSISPPPSFVSGTDHTSNDSSLLSLIALRKSPYMNSLHSLVTQRPALQWLNIARELASPYLSFRREEVHTLVTQAAWQLGPLSDGNREWHVDLSISSFGNALLRELESLLETIRTNWLEEVTVRTIG
ncbi:hypothetical protein BJV77DRAFT_1094627, partial [Russula vinacea]